MGKERRNGWALTQPAPASAIRGRGGGGLWVQAEKQERGPVGVGAEAPLAARLRPGSPGLDGAFHDYTALIAKLHAAKALAVMAADPRSLHDAR